jgi:hypothetical protein
MQRENKKIQKWSQARGAACNPSYLGGQSDPSHAKTSPGNRARLCLKYRKRKKILK